jgi:predicted transposase YdaD
LPEFPNPHDRFFKEVFGRPETARDFLANYLPREAAETLDLLNLELVKDSFVDSKLREYFSDLLYRVGLKRGEGAFVYLLFEHKSAPDEWVAFQLLRYIVRIWETELERKVRKLIPIVPLVLYHGRGKWEVDRTFSALIEWQQAEHLKRYVPDFEYYVCDLAEYSREEIHGTAVLQIALLAMKYVFSDNPGLRLTEILRMSRTLLTEDANGLKYLSTVLFYFAAAAKGLTRAQLSAAVKRGLPKQEGWIMSTLAETWIKEGMKRGRRQGVREGIEQGIQQGIEQGIEQGIRKGKAVLTVRQLQARLGRLDSRTRARIGRLPVESLEDLGIALLEFETRGDLISWLRDHAGK